MTDRTQIETSAPSHRPLVLTNARLVDPATSRDEIAGILLENSIITEIGAHLLTDIPARAQKIDCLGNVVCPGLIDMQVYTGEPGNEHRETLATASQAAAAGGVTTIICMPNTEPVIDDVALVDFMMRRARDTAIVKVHPLAALTKDLKGKKMAEIGLLKSAGAVAFTNGKESIADAQIMRRVLSYSADFDALVIHNTEENSMTEAGVMNESEVSSRLGLPGIPVEAETIMLERDLRLVSLTGARYHAALISCRASLEAMRSAKKAGLPVTCGVSINHLALNENDIGPYRTFFKIRPPLRSEDDRMSLVEALANGEIDVIVSSHDPQDVDGKRHPFSEAIDGAIGLETLLPVALRLYHNGQIDLLTLLKPLTINPAKLLDLPTGRLEVGAPADVTVFDLEAPWIVNPDDLHSISKNTPFEEAELQGRILLTIVNGKIVFDQASSPKIK